METGVLDGMVLLGGNQEDARKPQGAPCVWVENNHTEVCEKNDPRERRKTRKVGHMNTRGRWWPLAPFASGPVVLLLGMW